MVVGSPSHSCVLRPLRSPGQSDSGPLLAPSCFSATPGRSPLVAEDQDNVGWVLS